LALAETIEEIKLLGDAADVYQNLMKKRGIVKSKVDEIGEFIIDIEIKEAEWLNEKYPSRVKGNANKLSGLDREPDMPVYHFSRARELQPPCQVR